jgi:hypothetical protein
MTELPTNDQMDVTHILVKPLYFGMLVNVTIPLVLLLIIYFLNKGAGGMNHFGEGNQTLLFVFVGLAGLQTVGIIWWREKLFKSPMIRRPEQFESDFAKEYLSRCKPLFYAISSLSLYGVLFYFLTKQFTEAAIFVLLSYVIFQLVRPRHGLVHKLIDRQRELVQKGQLLQD